MWKIMIINFVLHILLVLHNKYYMVLFKSQSQETSVLGCYIKNLADFLYSIIKQTDRKLYCFTI